MPLSNTGKVVEMAAPEKSELPAWLESLRTGEHPAVSASGPSSFSGPDIIDEGALPSWMRNENADSSENAASGPYPARRPASMPAPHTDSDFIPPRGIAASSLIDEQALPSWLQENNSSRQSSPSGLSASSLVQPDALPDWMRALQTPAVSTPPPVPPAVDPITPVQRMPAHDLVDQQALPPWLTGQTNAPEQPVRSPQAPQEHQQPMYPQASAQSGLAASSLLDMNALPGWLRENEPSQAQSPSSASPGSPPFAQPGQTQPSNTGNPLSAASLIDMNALPDWLRAPENLGMGRSNSANMGNAGNVGNVGSKTGASGARFNSSAHPQAPRPENMRVPSRPRGEMAPHEQSEVAANVFSSVLGVASTAPSFSSQPPGQGFGDSQGFSAGQSQPSMSQMPQTQGYMGYQGGYGGYSMGNQPAGSQQPASGSNMMPAMPGQEQNVPPSASKPARRGFLDTIRSWFSR